MIEFNCGVPLRAPDLSLLGNASDDPRFPKDSMAKRDPPRCNAVGKWENYARQ